MNRPPNLTEGALFLENLSPRLQGFPVVIHHSQLKWHKKNMKIPTKQQIGYTPGSTNVADTWKMGGPWMKMYFLSKMGIFQPAMFVYQRVTEKKLKSGMIIMGDVNFYPRKLIWNPKNWCLVDVSPFPRGYFQVNHLSFRVVVGFFQLDATCMDDFGGIYLLTVHPLWCFQISWIIFTREMIMGILATPSKANPPKK